MTNSTESQMTLFELDSGQSPKDCRNGFSDPNFAANKTLPIHRWVPWIAGFSSAFVADALSDRLSGAGTVLDPFCGVGTTLVESMLHGHGAVGFEINPYAALASRVKTQLGAVDIECLEGHIRSFIKFYHERVVSNYVPESAPPKGFRTRAPFYSPRVLHKVLIVHDYIRRIEDGALRDLFRLAFASRMVSFSNYSYEPSLGRRASAGKKDIDDYDVGGNIVGKLREFVSDVRWFKERFQASGPRVSVVNGSFFAVRNYMAPEFADILITSPPYLNNYHYSRNTRPHLYWLGFVDSSQDFRHLEQDNFGKFWQTVRGLDRLDLNFELPASRLPEQLEELRGLNQDKGIYGGNGWANYAAAYFNDCYRFCEAMRYSLKRGGTALIVIGNSILQGINVPTDQYFGEIAQVSGLELIGIETPRTTRVGNSIIRSDVRVGKAKKAEQLYEAVVELRRP